MAKRRQTFVFRGGYGKVFFLLNTVFNIILSSILITFALPFLLIISVIIKIQDGGPVIYKGIRLGHKKKHFMIYKFRTLVPNAEKIIGAEVLTGKHKLGTRTGKFLRDTRLDELPQLFNILKGDMDYVGPRPQRPLIYENICSHIKGYDKRFLIKPGLIGFPQLFIPHSAPKRIQSMVDNKYVDLKQKFLWDISFVIYTIFVVLKATFLKGCKYINNKIIRSIILREYGEKRSLERVMSTTSHVRIGSMVNGKEVLNYEAELKDINEEAFLVHTNHEIDKDCTVFVLQTEYKRSGRKGCKKKTAICSGKIYRKIELRDSFHKYSYVIMYTPISPFNYYIIHQYFLLESMV